MAKQRTLKIASFALIIACGVAGTVLGTLSWFKATGEVPEYKLNGKSAGAYFAYGDGSEDHPFGISIPRHLYNLSWLHYTGQFDDGQYYFELADTLENKGGVLDMSNYVLPPIGTEDKPFVGNFNGKGYVIENLTVTNDRSAIFNSFRHPDNTQVVYNEPEIVGLFGVVGNYNSAYTGTYDSETNTIHDLGINNFTIQTTTAKALVGIAAGYVDGTIANVAVNGSTIDIANASTAAVDATNLTANLSDYGVVGYCTDDHKKSVTKLEEDLYDITFADPANAEFNASDEGDSQGWGGSINMKTIYNRIVSLRKTKSTDVSGYGNGTFNWRIDKNYYNGVESTPNTTYNNINRSNSTNDAYSRYLGENESGHEYIGNYNVYARAAANGYGDNTTYGDQQFLYLCGGHLENHIYHTYYEHSGKYITDGNGNYLHYNNGTLGNSTNPDEASLWTFTVYSGSQYYITTTYNGTTYYLYYNNGALGTATSTGTTRRWTITENGNDLTISYNTSKIYYYEDEWKLVPTTDQTVVDYYTIQTTANNQTHYIGTGSTTGTNGTAQDTTTVGNAAHFFVEDNTNYVYFLKNGTTKYYLAHYYRRNNNQRLTFNTATNTNYYYLFTFNGTNLATSRPSYLRYNNGWTYDTTNHSITLTPTNKTINYSTFFLDNTFDDAAINRNGPDYHQTTADTNQTNAESHMYYTAEDTTYFPLNVEQDLASYVSATNTMNTEISSGHLDPKDSNTGYIISGSNIPTNLTTMAHTYSDIRISRYAITSINASYTKSSGNTTTISDLTNDKIWTYNTSNSEQTMTAALSANPKLYTRFNDSKTSLFQNSIASTSNGTSYTTNAYVYGLHFMDSTISKDAIVNANNVSILGNKCDTYQFPVDCIDFNLKQKGLINFFAGTYFSGNDSFFSLHEIIRNDDAVVKGDPEDKEYTSYNTINDIKEIEEIWSTDDGEKTTKYANIYKYKGATGSDMYSVPYRIDGNQNKYNMDRYDNTDLTTPYTYATMSQTMFDAYCSTYGYTLKFKTAQIGKQNSAYTTNRLYYFEFPMNPGEYCLGSVPGGTGAYLLYLDIGANAAKTQRTTVYEHYKEIEKVFEYPEGVAVVALTTVADNIANNRAIDETNTSNFLILAGNASVGTVKVTRTGNDVELARTGGLLTSAKPTLVGDLMWDSTYLQYNIHKPSDDGGDNLTSEITARLTESEVRAVKYYDWNVNLEELTITKIMDTTTDGGSTWTRTFYQEYQNGDSTTEFSEMKIYNTNSGTKYTEEDLANPSTSSVKTYAGASESSVNTTLICKISYQLDNGEEITKEWELLLVLDEDGQGHYFIISDDGALYNFAATLNQGSVTVTVLSVGSRSVTINGTPVSEGSIVTIIP